MNNDDIPKYPLYGYDNAEELDRDVEYMKGIYPLTVRQIQDEVDEELDKLEYEGSIMFDLLPDTVSLGRLVDKIYDRVAQNDYAPIQTENVHSYNLPCYGRNCPPPYPPNPPYPPGYCGPNRPCPPPPGGARPDFDRYGNPDWTRNLITSLLFNELIHRRRRYRSRRRWF